MFQNQLKKLIRKEFPNETLKEISNLPLALTTVAYKISFKSGQKLVVKIGFDEKDIAKGKGEKEEAAIEKANTLIGFERSPKLVKYFVTYHGFPGYVTFLEFFEGKTLEPKEFNSVASREDNLELLANLLIKLHAFRQKSFSDMLPNGKRNISEYFADNHEKIRRVLETNNLFNKLEKSFDELPAIYEYFKDHSEHCFLHGDVNFKNVIASGEKIKALIDWDRCLIAPIAFEFAQVSTLTDQYGVTVWHKKLIETYLKKYEGDTEKLYKEFKMVELFIYFKMLMRKLTHKLQRDTVQLCADTNEELTEHFIRKIIEHKL
jgi:thiamine kinase-like enzyme